MGDFRLYEVEDGDDRCQSDGGVDAAALVCFDRGGAVCLVTRTHGAFGGASVFA